MNMVCYERVYYEQVCCERGLFRVVSYEQLCFQRAPWFSGRKLLRTKQVHVEELVQKMETVTNRWQHANSWFYSFQKWHPRWLDCGCLMFTQVIQTVSRNVESTRSCGSPTFKVNGCDLIPLTRTEISEWEYNYLMASNRRLSAPYTRNTPGSLQQTTRSCAFSKSKRHVWTSLWYSQPFSEMCWRVKIWSTVVYSATTGTTTALGNLHTLFQGG